MGHKKTWRFTFVYIFANYWPIFKILWLAHSADNSQQRYYYISHHTVNASLHYLVKYKCKQKLTIITEIKINEKNNSDKHCDKWSVDTRLCWTHTVWCHTDHSLYDVMLVKGVFFNFTKMFVIIVVYAYFINISQNSVETHLRCGGMCNNHVIPNCLHSVPVKEF